MFVEMQNRENSFVMGTGYHLNPFEDLPHCLTVTEVSANNISTYDCRRQTHSERTHDIAIKSLKYICGYFGDMLG